MKRGSKPDPFVLLDRLTLLQIFMVVMLVYLLFVSFEIPLTFRAGFSAENGAVFLTDALPMPLMLEESHNRVKFRGPRGLKLEKVSTLRFNESFSEDSEMHKVSELRRG